MKKMEVLKEEKGNVWEKIMEKADPILGYKLRFLGTNENQVIHKVEIRNINFQDVMRHLRQGETVLITPKLPGDTSAHSKKQADREPWYIAHL